MCLRVVWKVFVLTMKQMWYKYFTYFNFYCIITNFSKFHPMFYQCLSRVKTWATKRLVKIYKHRKINNYTKADFLCFYKCPSYLTHPLFSYQNLLKYFYALHWNLRIFTPLDASESSLCHYSTICQQRSWHLSALFSDPSKWKFGNV